MNTHILQVYNSSLKKFRVGRKNDGGYVICELSVKYDLFLSGGIANDISFEEDFCERFENVQCYAHDGTISGISVRNKHVHIVRKNIGAVENSKNTNLHEYLSTHKSVFIKMDIEGHEIPWLESLTEEHMNNISQMVIEFHFPFSAREMKVFEKLNKTHLLVHFHGNNARSVRRAYNTIVPEVFECTYVHKKFVNEPYLFNSAVIPSALDMANIPSSSDIVINHWPFVTGSSSGAKSSLPPPIWGIRKFL